MVPTKVRYINAEWKHKDLAPKIGSKGPEEKIQPIRMFW